MTHAERPNEPGLPANEDESMDRLLHFAGPRKGLPGGAMARLEEVARPVWREKVRAQARRRRRRTYQYLAAAASVIAAAGLAYWLGPFEIGTGGGALGTVEARAGRATVESRGRLEVGDALQSGQAVETGADGRVALRLASGPSVRLDVDTRLSLESARRLLLERGAVYVDTEGGRGTSLGVGTRYGVAHDVGTQFEVRIGGDRVRVKVREGEVRFDTAAESHPAAAGTVLTVHEDGTVERDALESFAAEWSWTSETRPPFSIEGRTVRQVLEWFSRETGLAVRYEGPVVERIDSVITAGSVEGLSPIEILEAVLPGAGLSFRIEEGTVAVSL